jgi:hypothetical protein
LRRDQDSSFSEGAVTDEGTAERMAFTVRNGCVRLTFLQRNSRHIEVASDARSLRNRRSRRMIMKTILSALLALSLLAGIAAPASAANDYNPNIGGRDVGQSSPL